MGRRVHSKKGGRADIVSDLLILETISRVIDVWVVGGLAVRMEIRDLTCPGESLQSHRSQSKVLDGYPVTLIQLLA